MKKYYYLIILLIGCISCNKDDSDSNEPFIVGDIVTNSFYTLYDPPLELLASIPEEIYNINSMSDSLDIDKDGLIDFILYCENELVFMGEYQATTINVFNKNFEIAFETYTDSMNHYNFTLNDTVYDVYYDFEKNYIPPVPYNVTKYYGWFDQPKKVEEGDSITDNLYWTNSSLAFSIRDSSTMIISDAANIQVRNLEDGNWIGSGVKYVVIKLKKNELTYYGWIKVELIDPSRAYIYETYFQKNGFLD